MALFILSGNSSSFSIRFYILSLIGLFLVCFCSYCSSTSLVSPIINVDSSSDDIEMYDINDGIKYHLPSNHYINVPEQAILPSKNRFLHLLFKSNLIQPVYQNKEYNNKRYAIQAFHAMRG